MKTIETQCKKAFLASPEIGILSTKIKNQALLKMATAIIDNKQKIITSNKIDLDNGKKNSSIVTNIIEKIK